MSDEQVEVSIVPTEVATMDCPRCGQVKPKSNRVMNHICEDCARAEDSRVSHMRQHNDWLAVAVESGVEPWLQQPEETQWEYTIWAEYRDSYPGHKPSYQEVARRLNTTYGVVRKVAQRWTFPVRMQLWMKQVNDITMLQRRDEILAMNKDHIDLASRLRKKLSDAIDNIDPQLVKPSEIGALLKVAAELEQKAHVDSLSQDEMRQHLLVDNDNPDLKKAPTKQSDLDEVVAILLKAGALGEVTKIGVKQTTEVVMMDESGASASMSLDSKD